MKKPRSGLIIVSVIFALAVYFLKFARTLAKAVFSLLFILFSAIFLKKKGFKLPFDSPFKRRAKDEKVYINYDDLEDMEDTLFEDTVHKNESESRKSSGYKKRVIRRNEETEKKSHTDTKSFGDETKVYTQDSKENNSGNKYIDELNLISENLEGDMKEKTLEIIRVSSKIFSFSKNSSFADEDFDREFKSLLISTIKMLQEYLDLSVLTFRTENALMTMENIENSMSTVIISYYKLLNEQYEKIIR